MDSKTAPRAQETLLKRRQAVRTRELGCLL